jgi:uncharacterized metal-binding protein YceD (DUF177 family)
MSLVVNLRHLEAHSLQLKGELPVEELDLDLRDDLVRAEKPLQYDLEAEQMEDGLLLQGRLLLPLRCLCVRCLKPFEFQLKLDKWAQLLPLVGEEKVSVVNDCVDLTPFVREDILLEFPQHPLCKTECSGLPKTFIGKVKKPSGSGPTKEQSSAWAALDKLKPKN